MSSHNTRYFRGSQRGQWRGQSRGQWRGQSRGRGFVPRRPRPTVLQPTTFEPQTVSVTQNYHYTTSNIPNVQQVPSTIPNIRQVPIQDNYTRYGQATYMEYTRPVLPKPMQPSMPPPNLNKCPSLSRREPDKQSTTQPRPEYNKLFDNVKQSPLVLPEFRISPRDFPALPGKKNRAKNGASMFTTPPSSPAPGPSGITPVTRSATYVEKLIAPKPRTKKKTMNSAPYSTLQNEFGLLGLLDLLFICVRNPYFKTLRMGDDLGPLGLDLISNGDFVERFGGPFALRPARPHEIDYNVPDEYRLNNAVRDKLPQLHLNKFKDEVLHFVFYTFGGDVQQMVAAAELFKRGWRFHIEHKVWIARTQGTSSSEASTSSATDVYLLFNPLIWRKVSQTTAPDFTKFEHCPEIPLKCPGKLSEDTNL